MPRALHASLPLLLVLAFACGQDCPPGQGLDAQGACRALAFDGASSDSEAGSDSDPSTVNEPGGQEDTDSPVPDDGLPTSPSTTYLGNISFYTREAMVQFCASFDRVYGDVTIAGPLIDDDVDFDCIKEVQGYLSVTDTRWTSWHLNSLQVIGRNLTVSNNEELASFTPVPPLVVGGDVNFSNDPELMTLSLDTLTVRGGLSLSTMNGLTSFTIAQPDPMNGPLSLSSCSALRSVDLSSVALNAEQVTIAGMVVLDDLSLGGVHGDPSSVVIYSNPALRGVSFTGLTGRIESLSVFGNPALDLIDLSNVASLGAFSVFSNGASLSLDLRAVVEVSASVTIPQSGVLRVDSLQHVGGDLLVSSTGLVDLDGLSAMRTVGGGLTISSNDSLTSVVGLSQLESIGGDLDISWNDLLGDAAANALVVEIGEENIGGDVTVRGN